MLKSLGLGNGGRRVRVGLGLDRVSGQHRVIREKGLSILRGNWSCDNDLKGCGGKKISIFCSG